MEVLSPKNAAAVLKKATQQLAGFEQPALEADVLLAHVLGVARNRLLSLEERTLNEDHLMQFNRLLERRLRGEPSAYLTTHREFWSLDLRVTPDVLIPRPETELLVELALQKIPHQAHWCIADLGTGSGAIALAIAKERPCCRVIATDISPAALEVAHDNAERLAIRNVAFRLGDWCSALHGERFDMIVSNPPYVANADPHLDALGYEPQLALVAGENGLQSLRAIATQAREYFTPSLALPRQGGGDIHDLTPPQGGGDTSDSPSPSGESEARGAEPWRSRERAGWLLLEHGYDQGAALLQMLTGLGYERVEDFADPAGIPRVTVAVAPGVL